MTIRVIAETESMPLKKEDREVAERIVRKINPNLYFGEYDKEGVSELLVEVADWERWTITMGDAFLAETLLKLIRR